MKNLKAKETMDNQKDELAIAIEKLMEWIKVKDQKATTFCALLGFSVKEIQGMIHHWFDFLPAAQRQDLIYHTVIHTEAKRCNFFLRDQGKEEGIKALVTHLSAIGYTQEALNAIVDRIDRKQVLNREHLKKELLLNTEVHICNEILQENQEKNLIEVEKYLLSKGHPTVFMEQIIDRLTFPIAVDYGNLKREWIVKNEINYCHRTIKRALTTEKLKVLENYFASKKYSLELLNQIFEKVVFSSSVDHEQVKAYLLLRIETKKFHRFVMNNGYSRTVDHKNYSKGLAAIKNYFTEKGYTLKFFLQIINGSLLNESFIVPFEIEQGNSYIEKLGGTKGLETIKYEILAKEYTEMALNKIIAGLSLPSTIDKEELKNEWFVETEIKKWNNYLEHLQPKLKSYGLKKCLLLKGYSKEMLYQIIAGIDFTKLPQNEAKLLKKQLITETKSYKCRHEIKEEGQQKRKKINFLKKWYFDGKIKKKETQQSSLAKQKVDWSCSITQDRSLKKIKDILSKQNKFKKPLKMIRHKDDRTGFSR